VSDDPFGTANLRKSVLAGWESSPTRFREDGNAEEDLVLGGYRDRLLVELAQNAADAARATGHAGTLRLSLVDDELRAANTGAPLDAEGVAALASLRASAKRDEQHVGQFGVGFAAVLTVTDAPRVVSRTGGVEFSRERTAAAASRDGRIPVLRLVWPVADSEPPPPEGFDTEVRLPLRSDVDGRALLDSFAGQVVDLLLALPGLARVEIGERAWERTEASGRIAIDGQLWLVCRASGTLSREVADALGVEARPQWTTCWAVPVAEDGSPRPLTQDVLHAPTPTDERLSLPARLIATLPIEPSRRRVRPGAAADAVLFEAARSYPDLVLRLDPLQRTSLVPQPDFPLSEVDSRLRDLVLAELRAATWLPPAADDEDLAPARAVVLDLPGEELARLVSDVLPGVLHGALGTQRHARALAALGISRMRAAELVAAVTGTNRPPTWWHRLYAALDPIAEVDSSVREELAALPVPLIDGRTLPGPAGTLLIDQELAELSELDVTGLRVVHPDAAHPLLERLGARPARSTDLLDSDALRDAVERSLDDVESGVDISGLTTAVLRLVAESALLPGEQPWLGALALPDTEGDHRRADELAMPGAEFLDLLVPDSPLGVLADRVAKVWPATVLTTVGVLDSLAIVDDESPAGPDHELPDEETWWEEQPEPPTHLLAVRDLDLVADHAWPAAIRLLAREPDTWRALTQRNGYTAWWIGNHARLAGHPPRHWRLPSATDLAGLYDPVPDVGLDERLLAAIGVRQAIDAGNAEEILARLGDPEREIPPGVILRSHAALAEAEADTEVEPPERVRTLDGRATPADGCVVLDGPWLLNLLPDERVVSAGEDIELAEPLAELLDLPLASEAIESTVDTVGEYVSWADLGAVRAACELIGIELPDGGPVVHDTLTVNGTRVPWWRDDNGRIHAEDDAGALARALAWQTGSWPDRHTLAALITDPEPRIQLS
jgi:hypothetical protein